MLYKLHMSILKEFLLLRRDFGGAIILFAMPLILIITVTLIQDSTFRNVSEARIPILLVDNDKGKVSASVLENLDKSKMFSVLTSVEGKPLTERSAQEAVFKGRYQLAIVIPANLSRDLQLKIDENVTKIMSNFEEDSVAKKPAPLHIAAKEVRLFFDPAVQLSFKNAVMSSVDKMVSKIETKSIYAAFKDQIGDKNMDFDEQGFINFREIVPKINNKDLIPNSVQHNVPAWTLFAIFFIVIPLSINIVKEKNQGTFVRLRTNPVSQLIVMGGKTITYLVICMIQFYMMACVAIFLFPHLDLPALNVNGKWQMLSIVAFFSAFAAIGYGILLGSLAKAQEQSAPFGATSVIILAAIGGVWVPVFAMPHMMQVVARSSPMNWGLNAFYDVLLRDAGILDILPEISMLFGFFLLTSTIALLYDKRKRTA